jgi:hypothetical protein
MRTLLLLIVVGWLSGCKKTVVDCTTIRKGMSAILQSQLKAAPPAMGEHVKDTIVSAADRTSSVMVTQCAQDGWTSEAVTCMAASTDNQSMSACRLKLTSEQIQKLDKARSEATSH